MQALFLFFAKNNDNPFIVIVVTGQERKNLFSWLNDKLNIYTGKDTQQFTCNAEEEIWQRLFSMA